MKPILALALLVPALALAACHKDGKGGDQRTASGEVLEGSISDSMIPYESLKSQPPLAPRSAPKSGAAASAADSATSDAAPAEDAPVEPAPAASPSAAIRY